jgi:hypothetical protein
MDKTKKNIRVGFIPIEKAEKLVGFWAAKPALNNKKTRFQPQFDVPVQSYHVPDLVCHRISLCWRLAGY